MSAKKNLVTHTTKAGGNVFADLGFPPHEAQRLKEESTTLIMKKLALRRALMRELSVWIAESALKQAEAACILAVSRPRISEVVNLKTEKFSVDTLIDLLGRAGKHVAITVSDQLPSKEAVRASARQTHP